VAHIDAARDLAARIPGAKFMEFDGDTHSLITLEPDRVLAAIEEFITGAPAHLRTNRVLASIMVLDMVESTKHAAALGDEAWKDLLLRHRATTDGLVAYYGGMVVDHAGDGVLATFDGPARSIRCAMDSIDKAHEFGLQLRGGIHTGEVEREGQSAAGIAVHMAARISASHNSRSSEPSAPSSMAVARSSAAHRTSKTRSDSSEASSAVRTTESGDNDVPFTKARCS